MQGKRNSFDDFTYRDTQLQFPKDVLNRDCDLCVFVYQERSNNENNKLIVYDIIKHEEYRPNFCQPETYSINPSPANCNFIDEDENGYNTFLLCMSSDLEELVDPY